ncbi:MAG: hypothetical protein AB1714_29010 [Acidobacteriota bacterium]
MRLRSVGALLLATVVSPGCVATSKVAPPAPVRVIVHGLAESIARYNEQCIISERLRAYATIEYSSLRTKKKSFNGAIYIDGLTQSLRLRADAYFVTLFDLTYLGGRFSVLVPSRRTMYRGDGDSFRGFAMQDLRDALMPRPLPPDGAGILLEETQREVVLTEVTNADGGALRPAQRVYLSRDDLSLARRSLFYSTGVIKSDLYYGRPQEFKAGRFPSRITVSRAWQENRVTLNLEKLDIPASFNERVFSLETPSGTKTVDIEPEMSDDILFMRGE